MPHGFPVPFHGCALCWTPNTRQGSILAMTNREDPGSKIELSVVFFDAFRDFRTVWPQLLATDVFARTVTLVILTPLIGLLFRLFLTTTDTGVLSDQEILEFVFHPIGFSALILIGACSLAALFAESGALMVIGFGCHEDRGLSALNATIYVWRRVPQLVRLAAHSLLRLIVAVVPFAVGFMIIYLAFLARHDINYYLGERPPELWLAASLCAVLVLGLAVLWLRMIAGWIVALPMVLFESSPPTAALAGSRRIIDNQAWRITAWLAMWLAAFVLISVLLTGAVGFLARLLIPELGSSLVSIAAGLGVVLVVSAFGNLALSTVTTLGFSLSVTRLYRMVSEHGRLQPPMAARGSLGDRSAIRRRSLYDLCGAVMIVVLVSGGAIFLAESIDGPDQVEIIAHRGASGAAPENTVAAFEAAVRDGADWIELDVQENAEGTVVVQHDSDFMRAAGVDLKVWSATAADLAVIDVGSWFDPRFSDQRVPTLSQVLELLKGKAGVVIELKYYGHEQDLEQRVVEIVEAAGMAAEVSVMSLEYAGAARTRALRPAWRVGVLSTVSAGDLTRLDVDFLALNGAAATPLMIRKAHKKGMDVYVWTVNDPIQMSVMMSRGVDGVITDEPAHARRVLQAREELGPFGRLLVWIGGETGLLRVPTSASNADDA